MARNNILTLIMRVLRSKRHGQNLTKLFLGRIMLEKLARFGDSFELVSWSILLEFFNLLYSNSFARFRILVAAPWWSLHRYFGILFSHSRWWWTGYWRSEENRFCLRLGLCYDSVNAFLLSFVAPIGQILLLASGETIVDAAVMDWGILVLSTDRVFNVVTVQGLMPNPRWDQFLKSVLLSSLIRHIYLGFLSPTLISVRLVCTYEIRLKCEYICFTPVSRFIFTNTHYTCISHTNNTWVIFSFLFTQIR